jgi:AAA domain
MNGYPSFDDTEAIIQDLYARGVLSHDPDPTPPEGQGDTRDRGDRGDRGDSRSRPRTLWTAAELMATDFPEPRWAVPGLVTEGVNLLAGPPKVGKSWLTLGLSLAVASGEIALSALKVEQGPALYLALEDTPRRLKDRLGRMLAGDPAPEALTLATVCPPLPDGGDALIAAWLKRNPDARLVVIDVFARIRGATPPGASVYDADYAAVVRAKVLADHFGVPFLLVHHVRKAGSTDFLETVSGSNGLAGAADTVLVLRRTSSTSLGGCGCWLPPAHRPGQPA